jgi:hypothetical protein
VKTAVRVDANILKSKLTVSGDHGSKYRVEAIIPGRQDEFHRNRNPGFRSANLIFVAPLTFSPTV